MDKVTVKISKYLASHFYLRLGTVTADSTPQVHTVGYVSEGCTVFFITDRKSRKAKNILANPAVAYAVDENYENILVIQGVQMEGRAAPVALETEAMRILDLMAQKFPDLEKIPANPDLMIFKIEPARGYFLDNSIAFGHRYRAEF
jgi:nitroimidazol reductase NimA-like FMN-containing flavoprotein (pyridoxamine 5'-phosphate oxidase superfamily)